MKTSTSLSVQYDNIFSPFPGRQWADGLRWVKDAGFDAVEIILSDPDLIDRRLLQKQLEQLDLPVSTISTGQAMGAGASVAGQRQPPDAGGDARPPASGHRLCRRAWAAARHHRPHPWRGGENSPEMELPLLQVP